MRAQAWYPGVAWLSRALASQVMFREIFLAHFTADHIFGGSDDLARQRQISSVERTSGDKRSSCGDGAHHYMRSSVIANARRQF
jgi:ribonuclease BN (tRNA processing enzyme)